MNERLDLKDRKLIYHLVQDSRVSRNALAKKVGLSKNAVNHRINMLMKSGVIEKFSIIANLASLQLNTAVVRFKFDMDIFKTPGLLDFFIKHDYSIWVAALTGEWDLVVEFVYNESMPLSEILESTIEKWEGCLHSYEVYPSNDSFRVEHLIEDFYKDIKELKESKFIEDKTVISKKPMNLDDKDRKILHSLSVNAGQSIVDIAAQLHLSLDVVHYRIKQLLKQGIIRKFYAETSSKKLGYDLYLNFFKIRNMPLKTIREFKDFLSGHRNITYAFFDINSGTFVFTCGFNSPERMELFLRETKEKFGKYNESWDYSLVKENLKFELFPQGLLKD